MYLQQRIFIFYSNSSSRLVAQSTSRDQTCKNSAPVHKKINCTDELDCMDLSHWYCKLHGKMAEMETSPSDAIQAEASEINMTAILKNVFKTTSRLSQNANRRSTC